jgi:hypothetical protein
VGLLRAVALQAKEKIGKVKVIFIYCDLKEV